MSTVNLTTEKTKTTNKEVVNFLFHEKTKNEKGQRKTIAAKVIGNKMNIGISICGPKDQFVKKLGRVIATGRAEKSPSVQIRIRKGQDIRQVFFRALKKL